MLQKLTLISFLILLGAFPFFVIAALFWGHEWMSVGALLAVCYYMAFFILGAHDVLRRPQVKKIKKGHIAYKITENLSCLLGLSLIHVMISKRQSQKIFFVERFFFPGYLIIGEKVLEVLSAGELKAFIYLILYRKKRGEGFLRLLLAATTFIYLFPASFLKKIDNELLHSLIDLYLAPIIKIKRSILAPPLLYDDIDLFNAGEVKSAVNKLISLINSSSEDFILSDFEMVSMFCLKNDAMSKKDTLSLRQYLQ